MKKYLALTFSLTLCAASNIALSQDYGSTKSSFFLKEDQINSLFVNVEHGDGMAALSLANYYLYYKEDKIMYESWLVKSAELGIPESQYSLALLNKSTNNKQYIYWLTEAIKLGSSLAALELANSCKENISLQCSYLELYETAARSGNLEGIKNTIFAQHEKGAFIKSLSWILIYYSLKEIDIKKDFEIIKVRNDVISKISKDELILAIDLANGNPAMNLCRELEN